MKNVSLKIVSFLISTMLAALFLPATGAHAQEPAESATSRELIAMLHQFLDDAAHNNAAGFDRFFADDVIYTRSAGVVTTKSDIMKSVSNARPASANNTTFSAEDVTVHEYPDMAVVAFRLVSHATRSDGTTEVTNYRNTGVFLRRNSKWQVIAWQSTKIPEATTPK